MLTSMHLVALLFIRLGCPLYWNYGTGYHSCTVCAKVLINSTFPLPMDDEIRRRYSWVSVDARGIFMLEHTNNVGTRSSLRITPMPGLASALDIPAYPKAAEHTTLEYDIVVWSLERSEQDGFSGWVERTLADVLGNGIESNLPLSVLIDKICVEPPCRLSFRVAQHPRNSEHMGSVIKACLSTTETEHSQICNWHRPVEWLGPFAGGHAGWRYGLVACQCVLLLSRLILCQVP